MYSRFVHLRHLLSTALLLIVFWLLLPHTSRAGPNPDAALLGTCLDQLVNGGFEAASFLGWTTGGSPQLWGQGGHTGWHSALLGGTNQDYDEISQELACPYSGDKVVVHAWIYMSTQDWEEWADWLELNSWDSRGAGGTSYYYNNNPAETWWEWTQTNSGPHACEPGIAWTVRFRAETDEGLPTWFFVDDVSLEVCCPDDAFEPNGSFGDARLVSPGMRDAWLCPNGDEDWFQFSAAAGQTIVADLISSWRVQVYDPAGGTSTAASQLQVQVRDQPAATPTATQQAQPTPTRTHTPTATQQSQPTPTRTHTPTATQQSQPTATRTPTRTATGQPPATLSRTLTPSATPPGWTGEQLFLPVVLRRLWQPRPQDCTELLANGGFETGALAPWGHIGDAGLGTGRSSAYGGQLGGRDNASGELWQWVTIPAGAEAVAWDFWWMAEAASVQLDDFLNVRLEAGGDEPTFLTLRAEAPLNVWQRATVDLSAWAGRRVLVGYLVQTDGSVPTTFRVDDVSVRSCVQP